MTEQEEALCTLAAARDYLSIMYLDDLPPRAWVRKRRNVVEAYEILGSLLAQIQSRAKPTADILRA